VLRATGVVTPSPKKGFDHAPSASQLSSSPCPSVVAHAADPAFVTVGGGVGTLIMAAKIADVINRVSAEGVVHSAV
jgi:hypothetical protein